MLAAKSFDHTNDRPNGNVGTDIDADTRRPINVIGHQSKRQNGIAWWDITSFDVLICDEHCQQTLNQGCKELMHNYEGKSNYREVLREQMWAVVAGRSEIAARDVVRKIKSLSGRFLAPCLSESEQKDHSEDYHNNNNSTAFRSSNEEGCDCTRRERDLSSIAHRWYEIGDEQAVEIVVSDFDQMRNQQQDAEVNGEEYRNLRGKDQRPQQSIENDSAIEGDGQQSGKNRGRSSSKSSIQSCSSPEPSEHRPSKMPRTENLSQTMIDDEDNSILQSADIVSADVLCGSFAEAINHEGSVRYISLLEETFDKYNQGRLEGVERGPDVDKEAIATDISRYIVNDVIDRHGGRFLFPIQSTDRTNRTWKRLSVKDAILMTRKYVLKQLNGEQLGSGTASDSQMPTSMTTQGECSLPAQSISHVNDDRNTPTNNGNVAQTAQAEPVQNRDDMTNSHSSPSTNRTTQATRLVEEGPPSDAEWPFEGSWPPGWTKQVYERQNGATAGTKDEYWYTPEKHLRLRSIAEVKRFVLGLNRTKGNEQQACELARKDKDGRKHVNETSQLVHSNDENHNDSQQKGVRRPNRNTNEDAARPFPISVGRRNDTTEIGVKTKADLTARLLFSIFREDQLHHPQKYVRMDRFDIHQEIKRIATDYHKTDFPSCRPEWSGQIRTEWVVMGSHDRKFYEDLVLHAVNANSSNEPHSRESENKGMEQSTTSSLPSTSNGLTSSTNAMKLFERLEATMERQVSEASAVLNAKGVRAQPRQLSNGAYPPQPTQFHSSNSGAVVNGSASTGSSDIERDSASLLGQRGAPSAVDSRNDMRMRQPSNEGGGEKGSVPLNDRNQSGSDDVVVVGERASTPILSKPSSGREMSELIDATFSSSRIANNMSSSLKNIGELTVWAKTLDPVIFRYFVTYGMIGRLIDFIDENKTDPRSLKIPLELLNACTHRYSANQLDSSTIRDILTASATMQETVITHNGINTLLCVLDCCLNEETPSDRRASGVLRVVWNCVSNNRAVLTHLRPEDQIIVVKHFFILIENAPIDFTRSASYALYVLSNMFNVAAIASQSGRDSSCLRLFTMQNIHFCLSILKTKKLVWMKDAGVRGGFVQFAHVLVLHYNAVKSVTDLDSDEEFLYCRTIASLCINILAEFGEPETITRSVQILAFLQLSTGYRLLRSDFPDVRIFTILSRVVEAQKLSEDVRKVAFKVLQRIEF